MYKRDKDIITDTEECFMGFYEREKYARITRKMVAQMINDIAKVSNSQQHCTEKEIVKTTSYNVLKCKMNFWEKSTLTLEEAAVYFGIGVNKLRQMSDERNCDFVLWVGSKRLIKKNALEKYLDKAYSI